MGPGDYLSGIRSSQRAMVQRKIIKQIVFLNNKSVGVPRRGLGESYMGSKFRIHTTAWLMVKDPDHRLGRVFKRASR